MSKLSLIGFLCFALFFMFFGFLIGQEWERANLIKVSVFDVDGETCAIGFQENDDAEIICHALKILSPDSIEKGYLWVK